MKRIVTKGKSLKEIVQETISALKKGGLVVFPTDTVYGLLVDASNPDAVAKLAAFKERPAGRAISVFVSDFGMMKEYVKVSTPSETRLKEMLPGPFTIVLPSKGKVGRGLEAENGTLGVRIPDNELVQELVKAYGKPVTATSANLSGKSPCYSVDALLKQLSARKSGMIDLIVDGGQLPKNKPSTVVDLSEDSIKVLREGDIPMKKSPVQISHTEQETKQIAKKILNEYIVGVAEKPLVIVLKGDLGAGKTIFVKGLAEDLGVTNIISPTFVVYYEYDVARPTVKKLIHFDLYRLQESNELEHLGIEDYLKPGNILCFEWGEKSAGIFDQLKKNARVIMVEINYRSEKERGLRVVS